MPTTIGCSSIAFTHHTAGIAHAHLVQNGPESGTEDGRPTKNVTRFSTECRTSRVGTTLPPYRAVYTVRFEAAVFVLHMFQKKSKAGVATPKPDMQLIETRLKRAAEIAEEMKRDSPKKS